MRKIKTRSFTGTNDPKERNYEKEHRKISRWAATEGFVLLKNEENVLPIAKDTKIALYGAGASKTVKGGTGSGDVNDREVVSIWEGLKSAGYTITTEDWMEDFDQTYEEARLAWKEEIWEKKDTLEIDESLRLFYAYSITPFCMPAGKLPKATDADVAIYVLSRIAGEGADRNNTPGDYQLSQEEENILGEVCRLYKKVIVVINTGGLVELSFMDKFTNICGLIQMMQPGMEAGNAFADVVSGKVTPSGKLTDSWAFSYDDYPNSSTFSHNNKDVEKERYEEGIYVGYRYFDTFSVPVRYTFGYGISYTDFDVHTMGIEHFDLGTDHPEIGIKVQVKNIGDTYSGKEVVQIYASCPQTKLKKEYRRLVGFGKTNLLAPGEMQELVIRFPLYQLASYWEKTKGWVLESGIYGIFVGTSLSDAAFAASLNIQDDIQLAKTEHICPQKEVLEEIQPCEENIKKRRDTWVNDSSCPCIYIKESDVVQQEIVYGTEDVNIPEEITAFVDSLSTEELILLATGDPGKAQETNLGSAGISVPGSAAQTSQCAADKNLASIVLADGPAGLRLTKKYYVENGNIVPLPFETNLEGGFLCKNQKEQTGDAWYQYCTSIPVGTLLAQTWDVSVLRELGRMVAKEMQEFGVTLWLAPGMNIHRNPLCGRNFEYYSEDPLLTGVMAAAMTEGVQSRPGCGTTIKHFACNNQEDNRMGSDSIISERTLREIYLKGFEIAIKTASPWSIMTSYNKINGIHAANNHDLCTKAARDEWGFAGVIMTDWTTTHHGPDCTASGCMRAGNDLVMPGRPEDHENMKQELEAGTLDLSDIKRRVAHLVEVVWKSGQYE